MERVAARYHVRCWIEKERNDYADTKYGEGTPQRQRAIDDTGIHPHLDDDSDWYVFITNYLQRVRIFGVDTQQGRQALGKLVVTLLHCLETSVLVYGDMPKPGVSSGEIEPWTSG